MTWRMTVPSVEELHAALPGSNPIVRQLVGRLTEEQLREYLAVLGGMLRERAQGDSEVVLESRMLVGRGRV